MSERKRPHWPLWIAALIGLPVLYVASIGPVVWIFAHSSPPDSVHTVVGWIYAPLEHAHKSGPEPFKALMWWYLDLWGWKL